METRLRHDYIFSERHVIDCKRFKANLISKINPGLVRRSESGSEIRICTEAYGVKVKGFHVLNAPLLIHKLIYVLKSIVKEKIANRIYIHNSYEELYEEIPKEILPKEYGGDLPSCNKLSGTQFEHVYHVFFYIETILDAMELNSDELKNYLKSDEAREVIEHSIKIVSYETRRSCIRFNEEYLGMPGSFKHLNVD